MSNSALAASLEALLSLATPPVAITFSELPPDGTPRVGQAAPAGCAYWKRAAEGESFYTLAEDHLGCVIGAYTHGAQLDAARGRELQDMIGTMAGLQYLSVDEVPQIPARKTPLLVVSYAPLSKATGVPDLVLVRAPARAAMLLAEATHGAGVDDPSASGIRPACAVVPRVLASTRAASSLGCIGNRVYTGLGDHELWYALPGGHVEAIVARLAIVANANRELEAFHRARLSPATA